ncbi:MAG: hypothetical protein IJW99_06490 [Clostridia bacterium]|nr:hypothetical protein [Clostridia bacterium]
MKITEVYIQGKKQDSRLCEDGLVITDGMVAVIDGVTSKGDRLFGGVPGGVFAKAVLAECLREADVASMTPQALFSRLSLTLRQATERICPDLAPYEYPRACVILYHDRTREIWSYGDCQCIVGGVCHDHGNEIDGLTSSLRALYLEAALLSGATEEAFAVRDVGRERIMDILRLQSLFENRMGPFGYPVINGGEICEEHIRVYPVAEGEEIVLASDGYPKLCATLAESEAFLRRVLEEDPYCYRLYRSTKGLAAENLSFDDRTYCRLTV